MRFASSGLFVCITLIVVGCGGAKTHEVSGTVTFDGEPVKEGHIAFAPGGGGGSITDGRYKFNSPPGKFTVQINASRMTKLPPGQTGMNGEKEEVREYIPEKYNTKTELKADVPSTGPVDFSLKSK
ncbi:hypothetical protein [Limnoglobus roseus]|uniref:Carboxypeptidase regulatory-like domain-containing protein n=1 Tax=Limnoglobus roseus TaxID=2598579 RepID=A0A5C1A8Y0_9BACT|nr:hypothetical protein [Limnoglobus roseus]QEL14252.1 carboxypeptidase regulatory-like domain-containing protein [Limnoglobus roseus]